LLELFDGENKKIGFGVFSNSGRISIRIFQHGEKLEPGYFRTRLRNLWKKKKILLAETNAIRLLNGENDLIPGIVVDIYNDICVIQYYSDSIYAMSRLISKLLPQILPAEHCKHIILRKAEKSGEKTPHTTRILRGNAPQTTIIREFDLQYEIDVLKGQKTGFFLDLRGVRRMLLQMDFTGAKVLNLFSGSGALSLILQKQGAESIISVEQSEKAQQMHRLNLNLNKMDNKKDLLICADVFRFLKEQAKEQEYDFIIIDPPCLATDRKALPLALKKLEQMHEMALKQLKTGSDWLSVCCTERIKREDFVRAVGRASKKIIGKGNTKIIRELEAEIDHKPGKSFPEGNYLKQVFFGAEVNAKQ
jgi:23S rRNA (cytosine1962-C5)-methyltransferase